MNFSPKCTNFIGESCFKAIRYFFSVTGKKGGFRSGKKELRRQLHNLKQKLACCLYTVGFSILFFMILLKFNDSNGFRLIAADWKWL
jgi:hypothetical protein